MKLHPRTLPVEAAAADIKSALIKLQRQHNLTDVEMLQAVEGWLAGKLKWMLRAERHPNNPEKGGDEA